MDVLWNFLGWTDVTLVTLGDWAVRESTVLVLAGAWVSVVGAAMTAPGAW